MAPNKKHPSGPGDEFAAADDTVIGKAFRWSIVVVALSALVVGGVVWVAIRPEPETQAQDVVTVAPEDIERSDNAPSVSFTDITIQSRFGRILIFCVLWNLSSSTSLFTNIADNSIFPPSGVNFEAFDKRLYRTCLSF